MPDSGSTTPTVSVIVPNYKRPDLLRKCLLSLFQQDLPGVEYEIIVVDSSPDDKPAAVFRELASQAMCPLRWYSKWPEGPGLSRNLGAQNARGRFLAFIDNDCQPSPQWLRTGLSAFTETTGIVQGRTLPDPQGHPGVFTHYILVERESYLYETCNIFYRREAFEQAGGFHGRDLTPRADSPIGGEDTDLAWRVKRNSWQSRFAAESVVYHEIIPISAWKWLFSKRMFVFPPVVRRFPELRRFMFARYFYDRNQAYFCLALTGILAARFFPLSLLLGLPYILRRGFEPSQTLRGPLRVLRLAAYSLRDGLAFAVLLAASLRYRSLLL
jgi:glycosyltransferase involved in cell wall biosynthesis